MRVTERCAKCLYEKQQQLTENESCLAEIKAVIDGRGEQDCSPYLVYLFSKIHEKYSGRTRSYRDEKRQYNDLVLSIENALRRDIEASGDPLVTAFLFARIGNYIDFGAMSDVNEQTFLSLFGEARLREEESAVLESFLRQCREGKNFLLITDNCGEIVLDKLFLEQLIKRFPHLKARAMVRGGEVLNDAVTEDAEYAGLDRVAELVSNGMPVGGTIYGMMPEEARRVLDEADVILAKGQGNYESLSGQGRHVFYSFLCKCEMFTERFRVPKLTGIFTEEWE